MVHSNGASQQKIGAGERAVDGLIAGIGAGVVMAVYVVLAGLIVGDGPAQVLSGFDPSATPSPVVGTLTHLAVAGVYGVLFGIASRWLPRGRRWVSVASGVAYGLLIFLVAQMVILPSTAAATLRAMPTVNFAIAHLVYGVTLGFVFSRGR